MGILFISDNHYLCLGVESENIKSLAVNDKQGIKKILPFTISEETVIIAIKSEKLLRSCINKFTHGNKNIIIMLREIDRGACFRIRNLIYSSMIFDSLHLKNLIRQHKKLSSIQFTARELEVLYRLNLSNTAIARQINISNKTRSLHNINIRNKIKVTTKNNIARLKAKRIIMENIHFPDMIKF